MADSGQLALLLHDGVDAWNAWRKEYKGVVPDLSGAHLTKADLAGGGGVKRQICIGQNLRDANLFTPIFASICVRQICRMPSWVSRSLAIQI